jgi:hypothetical protein
LHLHPRAVEVVKEVQNLCAFVPWLKAVEPTVCAIRNEFVDVVQFADEIDQDGVEGVCLCGVIVTCPEADRGRSVWEEVAKAISRPATVALVLFWCLQDRNAGQATHRVEGDTDVDVEFGLVPRVASA